MSVVRLVLAFVCTLALTSVAHAQSAGTSPTTGTSSQAPAPDLQLNPAEPDFTLGALPTTLRLPSGKFVFRLTHRFSRPIASGSASDFFADFFGFDSSAKVGLELRYGLRPGTQVAFHRTNDRAIQFLGQHELVGQDEHRALSADALVAIQGEDNFSEDFSTTVGAVLSHRFSGRGSVYLEPLLVFNANPAIDPPEDDHALLLGVGARVRLGQSRTYVVLEAAPQVAGYHDGVDHISVGIEKRAGGHMFQFIIANSLGTTMRQIARGGPHRDDWFIGFNLTRKFY